MLRPFITKQTAVTRKPISAEERLTVTLRSLATGESFNSLMYQYRTHHTTLSNIVVEVCQAIYNVLAPEYIRVPKHKPNGHHSKRNERWQFPNCYAVVDGKHVGIIYPRWLRVL